MTLVRRNSLLNNRVKMSCFRFIFILLSLQLFILSQSTATNNVFTPFAPVNVSVFLEWALWKSLYNKTYTGREESTRFKYWSSNFYQVLYFFQFSEPTNTFCFRLNSRIIEQEKLHLSTRQLFPYFRDNSIIPPVNC